MRKKRQAEEPDPESPEGWARAWARYAYRAHRGQRAVFQFDEWVVVYDAYVTADDPLRREREIAAFREWLRASSIAELAFATYPKTGANKGLSFAMVVDTHRSDDVHAALDKIIRGQEPTIAGRGRLLQFAPPRTKASSSGS